MRRGGMPLLLRGLSQAMSPYLVLKGVLVPRINVYCRQYLRFIVYRLDVSVYTFMKYDLLLTLFLHVR